MNRVLIHLERDQVNHLRYTYEKDNYPSFVLDPSFWNFDRWIGITTDDSSVVTIIEPDGWDVKAKGKHLADGQYLRKDVVNILKTLPEESGKYEFKLPVTPSEKITLSAIGKTQIIYAELNQAKQLIETCLNDTEFIDSIRKAADVIVDSFKQGGKIIICGNGGSMCDAMHFAAELTGRFKENRKPFPAIAISDPAHLSCVANDFGYDQVFARTIKALAKPEDVVMLITTSGNSSNILKSLERTAVIGCRAVLLAGHNGGEAIGYLDVYRKSSQKDVAIIVPSDVTARIQECHIKVIHILCTLIEQSLCGK